MEPNRSQSGLIFCALVAMQCLIFAALPSSAKAATITAASVSYAHVSAAVAQARDGDTVLIPAGTAAWSSTLILGTKAINLIGAGPDQTIITNQVGTLILWHNTGDKLLRLSGIHFNSSDNQNNIVAFYGPVFKARVDHCVFHKGDTAIGTNYIFGTGTYRGDGPVYGVVDHCEFYNMVRPYYALDGRRGETNSDGRSTSGKVAWDEWNAAPASFPGSEKMMVFEDNKFILDRDLTDVDSHGGFYGGFGGKATIRYNSFNGYCFYIDAHGDQGNYLMANNTPATDSPSTIFYDIYKNKFFEGDRTGMAVGCSQGELMYQRGGTWFVHDNEFTSRVIPMMMTVYFPSDIHTIRDTYIWGNSWNGNTNQGAVVGIKDSSYCKLPPRPDGTRLEGTCNYATHSCATTGDCGGQSCCGYSGAHLRLNQEYYLRAPQSGERFSSYQPLAYPHPLVTGDTTKRLQVTKQGTGQGTVSGTGIACGADCSETFNATASVTLNAVPADTNSVFARWTGSCSGTIPTCTLSVNGATTVGATFLRAIRNGDSVNITLDTLFEFHLVEAGSYNLVGLVTAPAPDADSFYVDFDHDPGSGANTGDETRKWNLARTSVPQEQQVSWPGANPKIFALGAGVHVLYVNTREIGALIQSMKFVSVGSMLEAPAAPGNLRVAP